MRFLFDARQSLDFDVRFFFDARQTREFAVRFSLCARQSYFSLDISSYVPNPIAPQKISPRLEIFSTLYIQHVILHDKIWYILYLFAIFN